MTLLRPFLLSSFLAISRSCKVSGYGVCSSKIFRDVVGTACHWKTDLRRSGPSLGPGSWELQGGRQDTTTTFDEKARSIKDEFYMLRRLFSHRRCWKTPNENKRVRWKYAIGTERATKVIYTKEHQPDARDSLADRWSST
jgi:hypothetical protein